MRRFVPILLLIFFWSPIYSQTLRSALSFDEPVFDFGEIPEKEGQVSHVFIFENISREPVVINKITAGCGCVRSNYPGGPVMPGQNAKITITYNPLYRPGFFSKEIVIFSNNHKTINRIWIKGSVIPYIHPVEEDYPYNYSNGLYMNLKILAFGKVVRGTSRHLTLRYANDTDRPMTLHFIADDAGQNITFTNPGKLAPRQRGEIIFTCLPLKKIQGEILIRIYPVVNGKKLSQPLQAKISEN